MFPVYSILAIIHSEPALHLPGNDDGTAQKLVGAAHIAHAGAKIGIGLRLVIDQFRDVDARWGI